LLELSSRNGFEHYEISNFARDKRYAQHNSGYWQGTPYIGIGAAAHSFNGNERRANVPNVSRYVSGIESGTTFFEKEILTPKQKYNELILTGLRTIFGVDLQRIARVAGTEFVRFFERQSAPLIAQRRLECNDRRFTIPHRLWETADRIILEMIA
jgi:oxygen-independent coproporphyrinogen-3 oxidase